MALALRSMTGCLRCRRRRIKCDESHPVCQRCQRSKLECIWPGRANVTSQYLQSTTTIGNLYARLFLQSELVDFEPSVSPESMWPCPVRHISPGYPPLRNANEHHSLVSLSSFLAMLHFDEQNARDIGNTFEFTVALQEIWVRDALLAFAAFTTRSLNRGGLWPHVHPYHISATRSIRQYVLGDLDETRLEQLLVASMFIGMIEINNPNNKILPLLHFEAVGRFLESLHGIQKNKTLGRSTKRFHRICTEAYLFFVSIQSLFRPETDHYPTLASLPDIENKTIRSNLEHTIVTKLNMQVYVVLFKLARLARLKSLDADQAAEAAALDQSIKELDGDASAELQTTAPNESKKVIFCSMTLVATSTLAILNAKIRDRSLLASNEMLRPLLDTAMGRLETTERWRHWTGDFVWIFVVIACAIHTPREYERFAHTVEKFMTGFWGADLARMKSILALVRSKRIALVQSSSNQEEPDVEAEDILNLLVEGRLSRLGHEFNF